jgi:hypothetical protein
MQPGVPGAHQGAVVADCREALEAGFDALEHVVLERALFGDELFRRGDQGPGAWVGEFRLGWGLFRLTVPGGPGARRLSGSMCGYGARFSVIDITRACVFPI